MPSSPSRRQQQGSSSHDGCHRVIVIGAGIAGLACARELQHRRYDVLVLEARKRCGGRLKGVAMEVSHANDTIDEGSRRNGQHHVPSSAVGSTRQQQQRQTGLDSSITNTNTTSSHPNSSSSHNATPSQQNQQQPQHHCVDMGGALVHGIDENPIYSLVQQMGVATHTVQECVLLDDKGRDVPSQQDERVAQTFNDCLEETFVRIQQQYEPTKSPQSRRCHNQSNVRLTDKDDDNNGRQTDKDNNTNERQTDNGDEDMNNEHQHALSFGALLDQVVQETCNHHQQQQQPQHTSSLDHTLMQWHRSNLEVSCGASLHRLGYQWNDDEPYGFDGAHVALEPSWKAIVEGLAKSNNNNNNDDLNIVYECIVQSVHYNQNDPDNHDGDNVKETPRSTNNKSSDNKRPRSSMSSLYMTTPPTATPNSSSISTTFSPRRQSRRLQGQSADVRRSARSNKGTPAAKLLIDDSTSLSYDAPLHHAPRSKKTEPKTATTKRPKVQVVVRIRNHGAPQVLEADAVVCTLPLGILKLAPRTHGHVRFDPPLPQFKLTAIEQLGCGLLNKCALSFPHVFWQDFEFLGVAASDTNGPHHLMLNASVVTGKPIVVFMFGGDYAQEMEHKTDQEIVDMCLEVLGKACRAPVPAPLDYVVTRWGCDVFARGAFVYIPPGVDGMKQLEAMSEPICAEDGTPVVLFAGEHTTPYHPSTIHGAFLSGIREAYRLDLTLEPDMNDHLEFESDHIYERTFPVKRRYKMTRAAMPPVQTPLLSRRRRRHGVMTLRKRRPQPKQTQEHVLQPSRRSQRTIGLEPEMKEEPTKQRRRLMERMLLRSYEAFQNWSLIHSKVFPLAGEDNSRRRMSLAQLRSIHQQLLHAQPKLPLPLSYQSWLAPVQVIPRPSGEAAPLFVDNDSVEAAERRKKSKRIVKTRDVLDL